MSAALKDLKVWQESVLLAGDLLRAVPVLGAFENALIQTATDIAGLIALAHAEYDQARPRDQYRTAKALLLRLETEIAIAKHAEKIPRAAHVDAQDRIQTLHRLLAGYLVYLDRQLKEGT